MGIDLTSLTGFDRIDIRQINFRALKKAGYRGVVFDKDNCLVLFPCASTFATVDLSFNRPSRTETP